MRDLTIAENITVDGVIDSAEGWFAPGDNDLIAAGLADEYRLFVYSVVLGRGHRLFEAHTELPRLRLLESRAFEPGVTLPRYRVA